MLLEIISKLISESLLSLYPIFVKFINLPLITQLWSRFFTYMLISSFFIDWSFIKNNILKKYSILLIITTLIHVYTSYRGFQLLDSGTSYILFYTYPIMIILFAYKQLYPIMLLSIIGVYILTKKEYENKDSEKRTVEYKERFKYEGLLMIFIAAITEAAIYFIVRNIKTTNHWNHLFISYSLVAILLSIYFIKDIDINSIKNININSIKEINLYNNVTISLIINGFIGLFGYMLRFFAMYNLSPMIYAPLSYFGVIMAYIYGIVFNNEILNINKIIGTILVIIPNLYLLEKTI